MRCLFILVVTVIAVVGYGCGGGRSAEPEFPLSVLYEDGRPVAELRDAAGSTVVRFKPGLIRLARVASSFEWD